MERGKLQHIFTAFEIVYSKLLVVLWMANTHFSFNNTVGDEVPERLLGLRVQHKLKDDESDTEE